MNLEATSDGDPEPRQETRRPASRGSRARKLSPVSTRDRAIAGFLGAFLIFPAWAFGGAPAWAQFVSLALASAAAVLAFAPQRGERIEFVRVRAALRHPAIASGGLLLAWIATQALNPAAALVADEKAWQLVAQPHVAWLPHGIQTPFAISNAWRSLLVFGAAWLAMIAILGGVRRRRVARFLLTIVALNAAGIAALGLAQRLTHTRLIFWNFPPPPTAAIFGPFFYRNHAAAFLVLTTAVAIALAVFHHQRTQERHERPGRASAFALIAVLLGLTVVFTYSRTGITLMAAVAITICGILFVRSRLRGGRHDNIATGLVISTVLGGLALIVIAAFVLPGVLARFRQLPTNEAELAEEQRVIVDRASLEMLRDTWPAGSGAGSFRFVFPKYQQHFAPIADPANHVGEDGTVRVSLMPERFVWEHAHNDLLEFPIELGLVGTLLLAATPLGWAITLWRARAWRFAPAAITIVGLGATVAHCGVDYIFQNPAVLWTWSALWPLVARWTSLERTRPASAVGNEN